LGMNWVSLASGETFGPQHSHQTCQLQVYSRTLHDATIKTVTGQTIIRSDFHT
jgi:hypothetical protein